MILVFAPDTSPETLDQVAREVADLGWSSEVSRADEQAILALTGDGDANALESALAGRFDVEVIPLRPAQESRLLRARRTLLTGLATGLGLLTAAGAGLPVVGFLRPPRRALDAPDVVAAGSVDQIAPGTARSVSFHGQQVLLISVEPGRYAASSAICTHMRACRLEWDAARRLLVCSCHGCEFDVHGNVVRGPASRPLPTFAVERVGDELFVRRS